MTRYLVVGLYADNHQRYATEVDVVYLEEAERVAIARCELDNGDDAELLIAAVIDEDGKVVA